MLMIVKVYDDAIIGLVLLTLLEDSFKDNIDLYLAIDWSLVNKSDKQS